MRPVQCFVGGCSAAMTALEPFREILTPNYPLGAQTCFHVGGPADYLAEPRTIDELASLVKACRSSALPFRILGGGTNILVPDEGVRGVVIRLTGPEFQKIDVNGTTVKAGAGAKLFDLISASTKASASGLEVLVGIPGSVGGAIHKNAGGRTGDIGQHVHSVTLMDDAGEISVRMRADIRFGFRQSNLDDVILDASFELVEENPEDIDRRIKKLWIAKTANQPLPQQAAGYVFRNSRSQDAVEVIESSGLRGARVGGAELSDRDPKYIVAHPEATARDILRLIDLVQSKVESKSHARIELQIDIWTNP